jgi:hypothetical protein
LTSESGTATVKGRSERQYEFQRPDRGTPGPARMPRPMCGSAPTSTSTRASQSLLENGTEEAKSACGRSHPLGGGGRSPSQCTTDNSFASCSWCQLAQLGAHAPQGRPALSTRFWVSLLIRSLDGEFDPGSGRTLAACLTHASRTRSNQSQDWGRPSGERVSNT